MHVIVTMRCMDFCIIGLGLNNFFLISKSVIICKGKWNLNMASIL